MCGSAGGFARRHLQTAVADDEPSARLTSALRTLATPEMVQMFGEDLSEDASRGVVNKVTRVKLLQGDLAESWSEHGRDYATVAMRFSILDTMVDLASGRIVSGDAARPVEVTEVWTMRRERGGDWLLSAIQQT